MGGRCKAGSRVVLGEDEFVEDLGPGRGDVDWGDSKPAGLIPIASAPPQSRWCH